MEQQDREKIISVMKEFLDAGLERILLSAPVEKGGMLKVKIRPLLLRDNLTFQVEELKGKQAFHRNLPQDECASYIADLLTGTFRQAELESGKGQVNILVGKRGTVTIKVKRVQSKITAVPTVVSHDRQKNYILQEGIPVAFLQDLGVMTPEGKIVKSRYDKFRQINRFLEFIEDILPRLDKKKENVIIDFGCGKSYLTFAMYYYLHELKGYSIRVIGLDLKQDVIDRCNQLSEQYGYDKLEFLHGDIASYEGTDHVDMVVTLHACDTATDYALAKAIAWDASVILSVPCCQHELNKQLNNEFLNPVLQYGLIKERMAALYTDAIRAEILENQGYRTQILEFIDMEHTPKNILIRAVKQGEKKDNGKQIAEILQFLGTKQTLAELVKPGGAVMEFWDLYDENRVQIGKTHVRGVPLEKGEYHVVADVWLVNEKNEILLTQRHPSKPYGLMWECTGGSVIAGEGSFEGALREMFEEVGVKAKKEDLHLIHSICLKERFVDTYITRQNVSKENLILQKEEVVDAKFVSFDQLLHLWEQGVVVPKSRFLLYEEKIRNFIQSSSENDD